MKPSLTDLQQAWFEEECSIQIGFYDCSAAECADIPDEVSYLIYDADNDPDFWPAFHEWNNYLDENGLRLVLEQASHNGLLLDDDMRATRLVSCPRVMVQGFKIFLEQCPYAVEDYLIFWNSLLVRIERARRTGSPEWHPVHAVSQRHA